MVPTPNTAVTQLSDTSTARGQTTQSTRRSCQSCTAPPGTFGRDVAVTQSMMLQKSMRMRRTRGPAGAEVDGAAAKADQQRGHGTATLHATGHVGPQYLPASAPASKSVTVCPIPETRQATRLRAATRPVMSVDPRRDDRATSACRNAEQRLHGPGGEGLTVGVSHQYASERSREPAASHHERRDSWRSRRRVYHRVLRSARPTPFREVARRIARPCTDRLSSVARQIRKTEPSSGSPRLAAPGVVRQRLAIFEGGVPRSKG